MNGETEDPGPGTLSTTDPQEVEAFNFDDKDEIEKELVCNICSKLLNVAPIVYNDDIGNICGRCSSGSTLNGLGAVIRQRVYEDLIKHLHFPCSNKTYGCTDIISFDEVLQHEKNCRFQCVNCPLFYTSVFPEYSCSWSGNKKLLADHMKTHSDVFVDPPQFVWPDKGKNMIFFTTSGQQIMTVVIKFDKDSKFLCLVMLNGTELESECFRYQLELGDEDKSNSLILRRNRLESLTDLVDNLHTTEKTLEVDIDKISDMLQNPLKIYAKFGIVKKNKKEILQITGKKETEFVSCTSTRSQEIRKCAQLDEDLLAEIECLICNEYMIPPIYICTTGHSVCGDCKKQVQYCPTCRSVLGNGRNFTLEKLTTKLAYPCRNREIGCGITCSSDKIKQHQKVCELSENKCVLECFWKGALPSLYAHLLEHHADNLIENNTFVKKDITQDTAVGQYFIFTMGQLFCFRVKSGGAKNYGIRFNVLHIGSMEAKYKFTIWFSREAVLDGSNISITNQCANYAEMENNFKHDFLLSGELTKEHVLHNTTYYFKIMITI